MTTEKTYTLVLTDSQLDTIYDALAELGYGSDDENEMITISEINALIHEAVKKVE